AVALATGEPLLDTVAVVDVAGLCHLGGVSLGNAGQAGVPLQRRQAGAGSRLVGQLLLNGARRARGRSCRGLRGRGGGRAGGGGRGRGLGGPCHWLGGGRLRGGGTRGDGRGGRGRRGRLRRRGLGGLRRQ